MGYTTYFTGAIEIRPRLSDAFTIKINDMIDGGERTPKSFATILHSRQVQGGWPPAAGQNDHDIGGSMNCFMPSFYCQWELDKKDPECTRVVWNGGEKFYSYRAWLKYLVDLLFQLCLKRSIVIRFSGHIAYQGESGSDTGYLTITSNKSQPPSVLDFPTNEMMIMSSGLSAFKSRYDMFMHVLVAPATTIVKANETVEKKQKVTNAEVCVEIEDRSEAVICGDPFFDRKYVRPSRAGSSPLPDPNFDDLDDQFGHGKTIRLTKSLKKKLSAPLISVVSHLSVLVGSDGTGFMKGLLGIILEYYGRTRSCSGCGNRFWGPCQLWTCLARREGYGDECQVFGRYCSTECIRHQPQEKQGCPIVSSQRFKGWRQSHFDDELSKRDVRANELFATIAQLVDEPPQS
jgi:hypothetical protein